VSNPADFNGAKVLLFIGAALVVLRRDDKPGIPWPNALDLPGGARDPGETPEMCVLREVSEEIGLSISPGLLRWKQRLRRDWIFAAHLPAGTERQIVFGDEGQGWCLMPPQDYATHPEAIPHFASMVRRYLKEKA
jgi:8-oxo-dGTP diphosphatase